jgi:5'-3' exonuclease
MNTTKSWNDLESIENSIYIPSKTNSNKKSLLILDSNNLSFRWLRSKNHNNFQNKFIETINSLAKSYNAINVIACFDFGKSYYRMELLESYKGNRTLPETEEEIKHYEEFFACLNSIPDLLPYTYLKFRGVEADDLIAYLTENISKDYEHTWIVTSDRDMYQLVSENISIFNIFSKKEITLDSLYNTYELTPDEYLFSRIIEGDKGDNVIGVEGIGPKRAQKLAVEYKNIYNLINALPIKGKAKYIHNLNNSKDLLLLNEKLINLKKYNRIAIQSSKEGKEVWDNLCEIMQY